MQPISRRRALQLGGLGLASIAVGAVGLTWRTLSGYTTVPQAGIGRAGDIDQHRWSFDGAPRGGRGSGPDRRSASHRVELQRRLARPDAAAAPGRPVTRAVGQPAGQVTNLHVHGLHVSPENNGDNPFVTVEPGGTFDYDYQLAPDHPSGMFWYHPHHHGMVADQIFGGLYGAIIVDEPEGESGSIPITRERVLVISDISLNASGSIRPPSAMARMRGREGDLVLINGQVASTLEAHPGERERWRILNACTARYLRLRLDGQRLRLLGFDSGHLAEPPRLRGDPAPPR